MNALTLMLSLSLPVPRITPPADPTVVEQSTRHSRKGENGSSPRMVTQSTPYGPVMYVTEAQGGRPGSYFLPE